MSSIVVAEGFAVPLILEARSPLSLVSSKNPDKKSIDTLVQRDRLVYAIAMLVLSAERNG
jgi:hypothetical protein